MNNMKHRWRVESPVRVRIPEQERHSPSVYTKDGKKWFVTLGEGFSSIIVPPFVGKRLLRQIHIQRSIDARYPYMLHEREGIRVKHITAGNCHTELLDMFGIRVVPRDSHIFAGIRELLSISDERAKSLDSFLFK